MAPRFAKLLEMLLGDVSAKKKPIYFLTRCDHTRPPLFGRTCTWHPAAGSSGAAASSPQAALPPRRPVQHGRPRPRDLTAAYACSASRHPIAGSSPRRRLLAPSCSSSLPLHNHAVLATGATSPRSQSSHPQAIESQLGMLVSLACQMLDSHNRAPTVTTRPGITAKIYSAS